VSGAFLAGALVRPRRWCPLNLLWFRCGLWLHRIVSLTVIGFLFFVTITPIGLLMRAVGKDPLCPKRATASVPQSDRGSGSPESCAVAAPFWTVGQ
jgi:hypothetical protein